MFFFVPCENHTQAKWRINNIQSVEVTISGSTHYYETITWGEWPEGAEQPTPLASVAVGLGNLDGTYTLEPITDRLLVSENKRIVFSSYLPLVPDCLCGSGFSIQLNIVPGKPLIKKVEDTATPPSEDYMKGECSDCDGGTFASNIIFETQESRWPECNPLSSKCWSAGDIVGASVAQVHDWIEWAAGNGCQLPIKIHYGTGLFTGESGQVTFLTNSLQTHRALPNVYRYLISTSVPTPTSTTFAQNVLKSYFPFSGSLNDTPHASFSVDEILVRFADDTSVKAGADTTKNQCCSGRFSLTGSYVFGDLLSLSFSSCFGSGATGTADETSDGAITKVTLTDGGSGYAVLGRVEPTLSLGNDNTTPADVTITLDEFTDECGRPLWRVDSISVTDGGEGYTDGEELVITAAEGTTVVTAATGTITVPPSEPDIELTTADGTGAEFTVAVEQTEAEPPTWTITGVTFTGNTSGYVDGQAVTFGGDSVIEVAPAAAVVRTIRVEPTVEVVEDSVGGTGAVLTANLTAQGTVPETWAASSITISDPGAGYAPFFDVFRIEVVDGVSTSYGIFAVTSIGENGEIADVYLFEPGEFYKLTDELDFVELTDGGEFYGGTGEIESISITDGGAYYSENPSLAPHVASVTVNVNQNWPSQGAGAVITASVETNTLSEKFGEIVSLEVTSGGSGYLARTCENPLP